MSLVTEAHVRDVPDGKLVFSVLGPEGDTRHEWDKNNPAEVEAARVLFDSLVTQKRFSAFAIGGDETRTAVTKFDPATAKIVFTPPLVGG